MRYYWMMLVATAISLSILTPSVTADDAVVNTPTVIAAMKGEWELQPKAKDAYRQRLTFDGSRCGQWQRSDGTLPVSITFYVEGNELLLQHYYEPKGAFNYRLKQLRFDYNLGADTLTLTREDATETWKRVNKPDPKKPR